MFRWLTALAVVGAIALIPLGSAGASSTTAKRIVYVSGTHLRTIGANGTGTSDLGVIGNNPSFSSDGQTIVYDDGVSVQSIGASAVGGGPCAGTDPAISPNAKNVAYVSALGHVVVAALASCSTPTADLGLGSSPAWSPDGSEIVFVNASNDLAVAPSSGGSVQTLGTTPAAESDPSWSPDGSKIAYISGGELFVMDADGTNRKQLTSDALNESSPSWAPGGDEIAYATSSGGLYAITADGAGTRTLLPEGSGASRPDWGLAVANTSPPTITPQSGGTYADGTQLSASVGNWISVNAISFYSYQWKRCSSNGSGCSPIAGANGGTYTLTSADIGSKIRVTVTATTPDGSAPGTSPAVPGGTDVISAAAPKNVTPPTISGNTVVGQTLTASPGTWSGSNPVFTYQWQRCNSSGDASSCANIPGATANVYVPVSDDVGSTLRVLVTGTNSVGAATKESNTTAVIASTRPVNTAPPAIVVNYAADGTVSSYTATTGTWTGSPTITFTYQWKRCDSGGANCTNIAGATSSFYTPTPLDIGSRFRVAVTATNSYGTATETSDATNVLAGTPPANTVRPAISGTPTTGSVLYASTGTWTGSTPITYTYQWRHCDAGGGSCAAISGETSTSYVVQPVDVGSTIVVAVTARNAAGSATVASPPTAVIQAGAPPAIRPTMRTLPSFTGVLIRGRTLHARAGTWSGTTPITFSYQWQRCTASGATCIAIHGATRASYKLQAADVGKRIQLVVTATNTAGSTQASSSISKQVRKPKPRKRTH